MKHLSPEEIKAQISVIEKAAGKKLLRADLVSILAEHFLKEIKTKNEKTDREVEKTSKALDNHVFSYVRKHPQVFLKKLSLVLPSVFYTTKAEFDKQDGQVTFTFPLSKIPGSKQFYTAWLKAVEERNKSARYNNDEDLKNHIQRVLISVLVDRINANAGAVKAFNNLVESLKISL